MEHLRCSVIVLLWIGAATVLADFSVISKLAYNRSSASSIFFDTIDDFYVVLYLEPKSSDGSHMYSVLVYELVNDTRLRLVPPNGASNSDHINTDKIQFSVRQSSLNVGRISFEGLLCTIEKCDKVLIFDQDGIAISRSGSEYLCELNNAGVNSTNMQLVALTRSRTSTQEMNIYTQANAIRATICVDSSVKRVRLTCSDGSTTYSEVEDMSIRIANRIVNVFSLLSHNEKTAICVFSFPLSTSGPNDNGNIAERSILVLGKDVSPPIGLNVAEAQSDYLLYTLHTSGLVKKFYVSEDGVYLINEYESPATDHPFPKTNLRNDKLLLADRTNLVLLNVKEVCSEHTTLCECRQPKDPKCGWCLMIESCTEKLDCDNSVWLGASASSNEICIRTADVESVARDAPDPVELLIEADSEHSLSDLPNRYKCVFGVDNIRTQALVLAEDKVRCPPPPISAINSLFPPGRSLLLPVTLYDGRTKRYLPLSAQYRQVICSDIASCSKCVTSHNTCTWCVNEHICTNNTETDCPDSLDQTSTSDFGEPERCPAIISSNVKIPVSRPYELNLKIRNFPTSDNAVYYCLVQTGIEATVQLSARKDTDRIMCERHEYEMSSSPGSSSEKDFIVDTLLVDVAMGPEADEILTSTRVSLYDCGHYSVCTQCLQGSYNQSNGQSNCIWCQVSSRCLYSTCPDSQDTKISDRCPTLVIDTAHIQPKYIPVEGGLSLSIPGQGLLVGNGHKTARISVVGERMCDNVRATNNSKGQELLICQLPKVNNTQSSLLRVLINGILWEEQNLLTYYNPQLDSISIPDAKIDRVYGPLAGGTAVSIGGKDLDMLASTNWTIYFIDNRDESSQHKVNCSESISGGKILCITPPVAAVSSYHVKLVFTERQYSRVARQLSFQYKPDSIINDIYPDRVVAWGGINFYITGQNLDSVALPKAQFTGLFGTNRCSVNSSFIQCTYPTFKPISAKQHQNVTLIMDGIDTALTTKKITVHPNPIFNQFNQSQKAYSEELVLTGSRISNLANISEISVFVGSRRCNITSPIEDTLVVCKPPIYGRDNVPDNTNVTIKIYGISRYNVGKLTYNDVKVIEKNGHLSNATIGWIAGGGGIVVIIMVLVAVLLYRRSRYHKQRYKSMVKHVDQLESNSRHEIKQAFAELQTDMSDLMSDLNVTGIPYWEYKDFTFKILFPGQNDHPSLHKLMTRRKTVVTQALDKFEHLIYNKHFLISFIHTLEDQPTFTMHDKVQLAALLMLTLQHKMDYATHVMKDLLSELIDESIKKKHPKLLLRRSESVVEKMLTHWLSLCLYKYLRDHAGTPLFMLYKAIKHQIDKGPVDALTGEARYSLSQDRLIRQTIDTLPLTLIVQMNTGDELQVKVNDCDTPTQVKEKVLDTYYKNQAYSSRPLPSDYDLEWHPGMVGVPISDEDLTSQTVNGWKRLNTLAHYSIHDQAVMKLVSRHQQLTLHSDRSRDTDKLFDTLSTSKGTPRGTLNRPNTTSSSTANLQDHFVHNHISLWHLTKNPAQTLPKDRQQTMMSEIFLTRLLKTKGTLQDFIDKLFNIIFSADNLPPTIKFLFDFLDSEAQRHGITDPEVVHIWKNNSLNLRFWVNIIKNPEFVFDIHKSEIVDASLSSIAQTFIDSCANTESDFGADAPINKLLFAKDRPRYRKMLQSMYSDIRNQPTVADQTLNAHLSELSKMYPREFFRSSALMEIYQYAQRYQKQIIEDLEEGFPKHRNPNLTTLLRSINTTLDDRQTPVTDYV